MPEFDDYLRPDEARQRFAALLTPEAQANGCELIAVDGAKHLWVGEKYVRRVLDEIVRTVNPAAYPLPVEYDAAASWPGGEVRRVASIVVSG